MSNKVRAYSDATKVEIKQRDGCKCFFCDSKNDLTIAHIFVARRDGGKPVPENGMCICRKCHDKLDFGIGCTPDQQKIMQCQCERYLTLLYMRELTKEELTFEEYCHDKTDKNKTLVMKKKKW